MSSPEPTFGELEGRVLTLYGRGDLEGALDTVRDAAARFPDRLAYTAYWTACVEGVKGSPARAVAALTDAVDRSDVWWGRELLYDDPDLAALRGLPDFEKLVDECEHRGRTARAAKEVEWAVVEPPRPARSDAALIVLHGRTGNLVDSLDRWGPASATGVTTVVVQSSQMVAAGMHCWDDLDLAGRDISTAARAAVGREAGAILGGFSQGGGIAARMALARDPLPARGFVSVAPSFFREGVTPEAIVPLLTTAARAGIRGWMAIGERDDRYRPPAEHVARALEEAGVATRAFVMEGLGHEYPEPFDEEVGLALEFVLEQGTSSISP